MSGVRQQVVARDEDGMRLDRWFATHFPQVTFGHLQKLMRSGQIRVDSGRVKTNTRLTAGQVVRVPPIDAAPERPEGEINSKDADFLRDLILYEDDDLYVFNKPHGLASQGGSGTKRHMDGLLKSLPAPGRSAAFSGLPEGRPVRMDAPALEAVVARDPRS